MTYVTEEKLVASDSAVSEDGKGEAGGGGGKELVGRETWAGGSFQVVRGGRCTGDCETDVTRLNSWETIGDDSGDRR